MNIRIDDITADIGSADFTTDAGAAKFAEKMRSDYSVRELKVYEGFLFRWTFNTKEETQRFKKSWTDILDEANALIVQARTSGALGFEYKLWRSANGKVLPMPHQLLCDDVDELKSMSVVAIRQIVADAIERNATVRDVANKVDAAREDLEPIKNGVEFLVSKKRQRISNGRNAQKKATADPDIADAKKKAADDMARAVRLVCDDPDVKAGRRGALKDACIRVCDEFEGLGRKLPNGKYSQYAPLLGWRNEPIKWESLRRAYNAKYGSVRKVKSGAKSKPKRGTK